MKELGAIGAVIEDLDQIVTLVGSLPPCNNCYCARDEDGQFGTAVYVPSINNNNNFPSMENKNIFQDSRLRVPLLLKSLMRIRLGLGNVKLKMTFKFSDVKDVKMYDVFYVPKLSENLISVGAAARKGNTVQFKKS